MNGIWKMEIFNANLQIKQNTTKEITNINENNEMKRTENMERPLQECNLLGSLLCE
jgi:hypothetical protein